MVQPPSEPLPDSAAEDPWAFWMGWAWVGALVAGAAAVLLGLDRLARALDLQSLLG